MSSSQQVNTHDLERKVFSRVIFISALIIIIYLIYDAFRLKLEPANWIINLTIFSLYIICYILLKTSKHFVLVRRSVFAFTTLSMIGGFFSLNGFNGIAALDIANQFVLIALLFEGIERKVMSGIYFLIVMGFCFIQGFHPEIITTRPLDTSWFDILEVIFRFITAYNLGYTMKHEYDKEFRHVRDMNYELQELNEEIVAQNEEISQQREEILLMNESLEELVQERTKKVKEQNTRLLDYAFFNAHKVRGPLARILGLVGVTKLISEQESKDPYFILIEESAIELDTVVKEINILLSDSDKI